MSRYGAVDIIREMLVNSRRLREALAPDMHAEGIQETAASSAKEEGRGASTNCGASGR